MNDNFDLRKFLVESKAIENMNPIFRKLNENAENITIDGKLVTNATQNGDKSYDVTFEDGTIKTFWVNQDEWDELNNKYGTGKPNPFPLNENTLRAKIREMVLAELGGGEDYDLESRKRELGIDDEEDNDYSDYFFDIDTPEDDLYEAKKKKEDVEDVPADDAELDLDMTMDTEPATPEDELNVAAAGATGDSKEMIDHLMKALDNAKASGNEKLVTQVLNTLKFAIDQSIVD